jgi:UDP-N-acetylmuramoylalanine--D-glutamate ligase
MKIAIVGFDRQGRSALRHWQQPGNTLVICDINPKLETPDDVESRLGPDYLKGLGEFDLIVRTPGQHPRFIQEANPDAPDILNRVTTVTNEFFKLSPSRNIIGVTGTKGKGTTCTLIAHMLQEAGLRVHLGGNIGLSPLDMIDGSGGLDGTNQPIQPDDWVVLELANFQLIDIGHSPKIGVCLMVVPEHLDWHTSQAEYFTSKKQLFAHQTRDDTAVYYAHNELSRYTVTDTPAHKIGYMGGGGADVIGGKVEIDERAICSVDDIQLVGRHSWQNVCAAVTAAWQVTQDKDAIKRAIRRLHGLPHRIEPVATKNKIVYYNDSFATAPGATIAAIEAITQPKVLIIGGYERGNDLSDLLQTVKSNEASIRAIIAIGASKQRIANESSQLGITNVHESNAATMVQIVDEAHGLAQPGDAVLLSPAFASFDMFKNFEERGDQFRQVVQSL